MQLGSGTEGLGCESNDPNPDLDSDDLNPPENSDLDEEPEA